MFFLGHLQAELTMLVYWKGGLVNIGGMGVPLFFLLQPLLYLHHWHALSGWVNVYSINLVRKPV
jgi:hypothetical protein